MTEERAVFMEKLEAELQPIIAKGQRARYILQTTGWNHDVKPYLAMREAELSKGSSWKPGGSTDIGAIAIGAAYNGGRQDECFNLQNQLLIWEEQGNIAQKKLEQERKK
jgi:hypothetical protein